MPLPHECFGTGAAVTHSELQGEYWDYSMMCYMQVCKTLLQHRALVKGKVNYFPERTAQHLSG